MLSTPKDAGPFMFIGGTEAFGGVAWDAASVDDSFVSPAPPLFLTGSELVSVTGEMATKTTDAANYRFPVPASAPLGFTFHNQAAKGVWSASEAAVISDALYFLTEGLRGTPHQYIAERLAQVPVNVLADTEFLGGAWEPEEGHIVVSRPLLKSFFYAVTVLSHEADHAQYDLAQAGDVAQQLEREKRAHTNTGMILDTLYQKVASLDVDPVLREVWKAELKLKSREQAFGLAEYVSMERIVFGVITVCDRITAQGAGSGVKAVRDAAFGIAQPFFFGQCENPLGEIRALLSRIEQLSPKPPLLAAYVGEWNQAANSLEEAKNNHFRSMTEFKTAFRAWQDQNP